MMNLGIGPALLIAVTLVGAAACADDGSSEPTPASLAVSGTATPVDAADQTIPVTVVPVETTAPALDAPVDDAPVDDAPSTTVSDRLPLRQETPLDAGAYRTTQLAGPLLTIDVDLPTDGLFALDEEGAMSIGPDGGIAFVSIFHLDNGTVLEPTIDQSMLTDSDYARSVSQPVPPDVLEWLADRPGVEAGPVEDSEFGGVASRRRSVSFGPFDGAQPCIFGDDRACHWLVRAPVTGLAFLQNVGDGLVVHEFTVAGHRLLVLIDTTYSQETSAAIADSVRFGVVPHPAAPDGSEPLPFAGPLQDGRTYVHERSTGGVWTVGGDDSVEVVAGFLRDRFVRLSAGGSQCMSFTDATQGFWFGVSAGPDGEVDADGRKMSDDIATLIGESPDLEIVDRPVDVDLGGVTGIAYDVRPVGNDDVVLASTSITATAGAVTRVIAAPRADDEGTDLATVTLGSPCEALLDGLTFIPGAER